MKISLPRFRSQGAVADRELLSAFAHEAARKEHPMEAYALWNELDRLRPSDIYRVMALETARLAGVLPFLQLGKRDTVGMVTHVLNAEAAQHLVGDVIRRSPSLSERDFDLVCSKYSPMPEVIRRALITSAVRDHDAPRLAALDARPVELRRVASAPSVESVRLFDEIEADLPPLTAVYTQYPLDDERIAARFREATLLKIGHAVATSESDAISVDGSWYFDALTYPNSSMLDTTADPVVLGFAGDAVAVPDHAHNTSDRMGPALWLAYPMTASWGHFLLECLTRLALFHSAADRPRTKVLVSSAVPGSFLDFARYLYPWAEFHGVAPGASVTIDDCWIIPSRTLTPGRFRWTQDGNEFPNMDPSSLKLLGEHMRQSLERNDYAAPQFPEHVYLDRTAGVNRRSDSEAMVREIAAQHGFHVVDPGSLTSADEVNLFVNAVHVAGFSGSQILLTVAARRPGRALYFYHDESSEMRSIAYSLGACTGSVPDWVIGARSRFVPGYSEQSIHQQVLLSAEAAAAAADWFAQTTAPPRP